MTPIRETIARAYVETVIGHPDPKWAEHWQWYLDGAKNPDSCVHYSNHSRGAKHADAVLRALDAEGLAVVPAEPTAAMVDAATRRPQSEAIDLGLYASIYRAMIGAATAPDDGGTPRAPSEKSASGRKIPL